MNEKYYYKEHKTSMYTESFSIRPVGGSGLATTALSPNKIDFYKTQYIYLPERRGDVSEAPLIFIPYPLYTNN